ncbi:MAG: oxygenase MpaB family protein [Jatrophihabitans sp.]|uniref:oxygenase MpaB family protein n=1 Tax=Jatrophihabitans sp. TaxID=1932789 RepID=UPI003F8107B9
MTSVRALPVTPAELRVRLAELVFERVAGPEGPARHEEIVAPGPRWFTPDRPIWRVHADAAMFVGGLRALLLQSLHPLVMTGVAQHSAYREDPWGRLARTSYFLAVTTYGPEDAAERAVARVRGIHQRINGVAADGRAYRARDPHLLRWVHVAEVDSFLAAYQRYGIGGRLDRDERDLYVADTATVAERLGVVDPPRTEAELHEQQAAYRPELRATPEAREAARFLLLKAPLPLPAKVPYAVLASAAIGLLPPWTRRPLRLPYLPLAERTVGRLGGHGVTAAIHWAMSARSGADAAAAVVDADVA